MRYAFLIAMVMHTGADTGTAMACQTQSDAQADESSTTVLQRDCTDQAVPDITPRKALPAIPSVGVKINPDASPQTPVPVNPVAVEPVAVAPKPKVLPVARTKPRVSQSYKAVVRRLRVRHAPELQQKPMFWWHIRK